jgi:serine/threonine protein kinase
MQADLLSGIGGHRVVRELGSGGMGRVYLCHDDALDRPVAVKVLQPELLDNDEMRQRFLREARALARVVSPHVVTVYAVGEDTVVGPFVVMEFLEGHDLQQRLEKEGRVPWRDAVRITRDAVQGLMAAEAAGIVHRDIKPANLFDVGGKAKLTDFGLARQVQGSAAVTQAGLIVGTPAYLAPEVVKGNPATHQSDLYSLGATLFHLVAGRPPFVATSAIEVLVEASSKEAPPLSSLAPDCPPALEALVARMLKKVPDERPQGWQRLDDELKAVLDGAGAAGRTQSFGASLLASTPALSASPDTSSSTMPTMTMHMVPPSSSSPPAPAPAEQRPALVLEGPPPPERPAPLLALVTPKRTLAAGAVLVVVVALVARGGGADRLKRIDGGGAKEVALEIEQIPAAERTGDDLLVLGHAKLALGDRGAAFDLYRLAEKKGAVDDRLRATALESLDKKDDFGAVELLAGWPNGSIERDVESLLKGKAWWPRHHALEVLEARKAADDDHREAVALVDVAADSCFDRKVGVLALKKVGKTQEALDAVKRLSAEPLRNPCMLLEMPDAERAIQKRLAE